MSPFLIKQLTINTYGTLRYKSANLILDEGGSSALHPR
jgi:hypothetical protein